MLQLHKADTAIYVGTFGSKVFHHDYQTALDYSFEYLETPSPSASSSSSHFFLLTPLFTVHLRLFYESLFGEMFSLKSQMNFQSIKSAICPSKGVTCVIISWWALFVYYNAYKIITNGMFEMLNSYNCDKQHTYTFTLKYIYATHNHFSASTLRFKIYCKVFKD